ncbi:protein FAM169B isoform X2 [Callorhinchus milii]|uniref:protein FAM169B isoform X2 n=1 Tax=Callorhinchus milii TaxID=7868 RepID=UPI000457232C|nr:protein FAM169B isoform X2 [Callorhinchus milii]|eukprot:gi/632938826/ref/XP_007906554.1/ PREDICTED: protein FAM169B isoform X2 [Callorhinchus milii]
MEGSREQNERGPCYPVDALTSWSWDMLRQSSEEYVSKLHSTDCPGAQYFSLLTGEKIPIRKSSVSWLSTCRENSEHVVLILFKPKEQQTVLALHLNGKWWSVEDVLKTSNSSRQNLVQVRSIGERIVLYVLNQIICGLWETSPGDVPFLIHPANEYAKVFWQQGEAAGFYTVKLKGSLCDDCTSQCYQLSVLDTVFVRRKYRRLGFGLQILHDFRCTFPEDHELGISHPISPTMYKGAPDSSTLTMHTEDEEEGQERGCEGRIGVAASKGGNPGGSSLPDISENNSDDKTPMEKRLKRKRKIEDFSEVSN